MIAWVTYERRELRWVTAIELAPINMSTILSPLKMGPGERAPRCGNRQSDMR
jgi:hypothetical protein